MKALDRLCWLVAILLLPVMALTALAIDTAPCSTDTECGCAFDCLEPAP